MNTPRREYFNPLRSPIGRRLLFQTLGLSFVLTLFITAYLLHSDYQRGLKQFESQLDQIKHSYLPSLSYSLWNFDQLQIESQLAGIMNFPGIQHVAIITLDQHTYQAGNQPRAHDERVLYNLTFELDEQNYPIGQLIIHRSYDQLHQDIQRRGVDILITQLIKMLSISILILYLVNRVVSRRLWKLSHWANSIELLPNHDIEAPRFNDSVKDELTQLVNAIRNMQERLQQEAATQLESRRQLENTKEKLAIAIDNASIGFCEYDVFNNQFQANHHFMRHIGLHNHNASLHPNLLKVLLNALQGEKADEQREYIDQLLNGMVHRIADHYTLATLYGEQRFLDITLQATHYANNKPTLVLICSTDKTDEHSASQQAKELTIDLENKITQRTEALYHEQHQAKNTIHRLNTQVHALSKRLEQQQEQRFHQLLTRELSRCKDHMPDGLLPIIYHYLVLVTPLNTATINVSRCIEEWLQQQPMTQQQQIQLALPLSLMLDESPQLLQFLLTHLVTQHPLLTVKNTIHLQVAIQGNQGVVHIRFADTAEQDEQSVPIAFELCQYIISTHLQGQLTQEKHDDGVCVRFDFALHKT